MTDQGRHEGFTKSQRLRQRAAFLLVQQRGRRFPGSNLVVYALVRTPDAGGTNARIGITVSKKVGNAVARNRVKRWIREGYRKMAMSLPEGLDIVVIARPSAAASSFQRTTRELCQLFSRMEKSWATA